MVKTDTTNHSHYTQSRDHQGFRDGIHTLLHWCFGFFGVCHHVRDVANFGLHTSADNHT